MPRRTHGLRRDTPIVVPLPMTAPDTGRRLPCLCSSPEPNTLQRAIRQEKSRPRRTTARCRVAQRQPNGAPTASVGRSTETSGPLPEELQEPWQPGLLQVRIGVAVGPSRPALEAEMGAKPTSLAGALGPGARASDYPGSGREACSRARKR